MSYVTTRDGTGIYYRDWGSGPPVVFSHGWPLTGDAWEAQMLFLNDHGFRAIAHDRRGHGRSDQPGTGNDVDTWADDLADLLTTLDLRDVVLVGHSTGGGEVARYIGRHGTSRLSKAVLIDSIVPGMLQTPDSPSGVPLAAIDGIRAGVLANRSTYYQEIAIPFFGANRAGSKATQGMRDAFWLQGMQGGLKAQFETTRSWERDYSDDIRKCDVPLLVLHSEDDQIVPVDATARRVSSLVPHAEVKIYPGGNHGIAITDPQVVNADLLDFIRGSAAAPELVIAQPISA
jgi:non-heme chloroperoxidase